MAPQSLSSLKADLSATKRYGLAVVSVALALALALSLERYDFRGVVPAFPILHCSDGLVWGARSWNSFSCALEFVFRLLLHRAPS